MVWLDALKFDLRINLEAGNDDELDKERYVYPSKINKCRHLISSWFWLVMMNSKMRMSIIVGCKWRWYIIMFWCLCFALLVLGRIGGACVWNMVLAVFFTVFFHLIEYFAHN